jgi:hypothetical protein
MTFKNIMQITQYQFLILTHKKLSKHKVPSIVGR